LGRPKPGCRVGMVLVSHPRPADSRCEHHPESSRYHLGTKLLRSGQAETAIRPAHRLDRDYLNARDRHLEPLRQICPGRQRHLRHDWRRRRQARSCGWQWRCQRQIRRRLRLDGWPRSDSRACPGRRGWRCQCRRDGRHSIRSPTATAVTTSERSQGDEDQSRSEEQRLHRRRLASAD
jgi:hypothetical protein